MQPPRPVGVKQQGLLDVGPTRRAGDERSLWGEVDDSIVYAFEPLREETAAERAAERETDARVDQIYIDAQVVTPAEVRARLSADPESPYDGLGEMEEGAFPEGVGEGGMEDGGTPPPGPEDDATSDRTLPERSGRRGASQAPRERSGEDPEDYDRRGGGGAERVVPSASRGGERRVVGDEQGHEPAGSPEGGQFMPVSGGGGGAKSETTTAKGTKAGVHELLSSGHAFSFDDLKKATGGTDKAVQNALSELKNPKWAGKLGPLKIVKDASGFHIEKDPSWSAETAAKPVAETPAAAPVGASFVSSNRERMRKLRASGIRNLRFRQR